MTPFRRSFALSSLCLSLWLVAPVLATEKADIDKILSTAREQNRVMEHLDHLSNRLGARLTSSDSLHDACEWSRDRFKSFGIENARLEQWGEFPVGFNRGPWTGRMVEPTTKALTFGTNSWTAGTRGVVRAKAVMVPENDEQLEKAKDSLAGAWVLYPAGGGRVIAAQEYRKKLDAAFEEAKIAGIVRSTSSDRILTGGNYQVSWDKLPETPSINLAKADFDEVAALVKDGKPVVLEFDVRNYFKKGPIPLFNVIADIPGTEFPDEYVIVGGHLDTWDGATGTTDNGTGCSTTLEAARLLIKSGVKPRRTIRFMLWSGEEQGLLGSRAYVKAHPELMKRISAVLVHDGGTNYLSGIGATKAMRKDLDEVFAPIIGLDPAMPFTVRDVPGLRGGGSDHASFLAAGVPGFFWNQSGKAVYPRTHHTQYDTYDAAVPEYQRHSSVVAALGALGIANLDHLLSRENMTPPPGAGGGPGGGGGLRRSLGAALDATSLKVVEVLEGSAAEKAGLKPGDEIIKIGDKAVGTREELVTALQAAEAPKKLVVKRDGKEIELPLTLPARP
jgi:carboxypeptidase Q